MCLYVQASWDFMHHHGNTSGSSNIAILHHELTRDQEKPREYIMCLAGGPGESVLKLALPSADVRHWHTSADASEFKMNCARYHSVVHNAPP